jgi:hypothetical protein
MAKFPHTLTAMTRSFVPALCALAVAACAGGHAPRAPVDARRPAVTVPMSDPDEYRIDTVSWSAGETIFTRTGIGDPYRTGIPYPLFLAMLRAYPDVLGSDAATFAKRFGFVERGHPVAKSADLDAREGVPIGMHLTVDPLTDTPFLVTNCSLCHAERVRWPGGEKLVFGIGNKRVRLHAYEAALVEIALRPDFDAGRLAPLADASAQAHDVVWSPDVSSAILEAAVRSFRTWAEGRIELAARTKGGAPGLVDVVDEFALAIGHALGRDIATSPLVGWSKVPDVVGYAQRTTLSWDAVTQGSMDALVVEADFAAGVRPDWFWKHPLQGASLSAYLRDPRRELPFPAPIDTTLATIGKAKFEEACSGCHGTYRADGTVLSYAERVVPIDAVGTDPARAFAPTDAFVAAANDEKLTLGLTKTRRTGGYVPPVLTSVWARAPYGHAGQWPTLAFLAIRPDARPKSYVVDFDAPLDLKSVGVVFRTTDAPLGAGETRRDATQPGASGAGHPFLANLADKDAAAVIEYLKTL